MDTLEMWSEEEAIEEYEELISRFLYLFQSGSKVFYEQILDIFSAQKMQADKLLEYASFFLTMFANFRKEPPSMDQCFLKNISRLVNFF